MTTLPSHRITRRTLIGAGTITSLGTGLAGDQAVTARPILFQLTGIGGGPTPTPDG